MSLSASVCLRAVISSAAILLMAAPLSADDNRVPRHDMPARWLYIPQHSQTLPPDDDWWRGFNDPLLDTLISVAVERNYNVAIAARRIAAADAAVKSARAGYFPSIGVSADYNMGRGSGNLAKAPLPATQSRAMSLGVNASWEIDLFGRVTASVRQEKELAAVARADYEGAMVSLCASLATAYMQLRAAQAREAVTAAHLKSQAEVLRITRERYKASLVSELDVAQANTVYESTLATLPSIRTSIASSVNAIALLLGMYPAEVDSMLTLPGPVPVYGATVATALPAELLRRRPDIVAAERTVAAQAAALGVARKEFMPSLTINGSFGVEARDPSRLFEKRSVTYSVTPTLSWTLFDGLGRRAAVEAARAELEISLDSYSQTVLGATAEVENALVSYINARDYSARLTEVVRSARKEVELSLAQYRSGLTLFTPVAQAQITYLQYDDELVNARVAESSALIDLYRALGGGYSPSASY